MPRFDKRLDHGLVALGEEQPAVELLDGVLVYARVADRVPVDVVNEQAILDGGEVAAPHSLLDAELVTSGAETAFDVVLVATPGRRGHTKLEAVSELAEKAVELAVLADMVRFVDHDQPRPPATKDS